MLLKMLTFTVLLFLITSLEILKGRETDILILGLPMVGDLRNNGLDTIKLLKDHIVPKL